MSTGRLINFLDAYLPWFNHTGLSFSPQIEVGNPQLIKLNQLIQQLTARNTIVVASTGNDGIFNLGSNQANIPSSFFDVISVGAYQLNGNNHERAIFDTYTDAHDIASNYGAVTIWAPGKDMFSHNKIFSNQVSTNPIGQAIAGYSDEFRVVEGTSYATPVVAGVVALIKSLDKSMNKSQVLDLLLLTGIPFDYTVSAQAFNAKRINAAAAVENVYNRISRPTATISTLSAYVGAAGETITITGTGFGITPLVKFGTVETQNVSATDTQVVVTVPAGLTIGQTYPVQVFVNNSPSNSINFTVTPSLTLDGLTHAAGEMGDQLILAGAGFGLSPTVKFGTAVAQNLIVSPTHITVAVPTTLTIGQTYPVTVTVDGNISNAHNFLILQPVTVNIPAISPTNGPPGTNLKIPGSNFTSHTGVSFQGQGNYAATIVGLTPTLLTAQVPEAPAGRYSVVVTNGSHATPTVQYDLVATNTPNIAQVTPNPVEVGGRLAITGNNLWPNAVLKIANQALPTTVSEGGTRLELILPESIDPGTYPSQICTFPPAGEQCSNTVSIQVVPVPLKVEMVQITNPILFSNGAQTANFRLRLRGVPAGQFLNLSIRLKPKGAGMGNLYCSVCGYYIDSNSAMGMSVSAGEFNVTYRVPGIAEWPDNYFGPPEKPWEDGRHTDELEVFYGSVKLGPVPPPTQPDLFPKVYWVYTASATIQAPAEVIADGRSADILVTDIQDKAGRTVPDGTLIRFSNIYWGLWAVNGGETINAIGLVSSGGNATATYKTREQPTGWAWPDGTNDCFYATGLQANTNDLNQMLDKQIHCIKTYRPPAF